MSLNESVASKIRAEMARRKQSKKTLASELGVSYAHALRLVNGDRVFTLDQIEKVADYLKISIMSLTHGDDHER